MLCREIMAVCFKNHMSHIDTLCEQNSEFIVLKLPAPTQGMSFKTVIQPACRNVISRRHIRHLQFVSFPPLVCQQFVLN